MNFCFYQIRITSYLKFRVTLIFIVLLTLIFHLISFPRLNFPIIKCQWWFLDWYFFIDFQVYYERVNSYSASATFAHAYCGFKDVSRNLILDSCGPITKIRFSKGFAFSNIEAASGKTLQRYKSITIYNKNHIGYLNK